MSIVYSLSISYWAMTLFRVTVSFSISILWTCSEMRMCSVLSAHIMYVVLGCSGDLRTRKFIWSITLNVMWAWVNTDSWQLWNRGFWLLANFELLIIIQVAFRGTWTVSVNITDTCKHTQDLVDWTHIYVSCHHHSLFTMSVMSYASRIFYFMMQTKRANYGWL